jgi:hypothetical protein
MVQVVFINCLSTDQGDGRRQNPSKIFAQFVRNYGGASVPSTDALTGRFENCPPQVPKPSLPAGNLQPPSHRAAPGEAARMDEIRIRAEWG